MINLTLDNKMVVKREVKCDDGSSVNEWRFRQESVTALFACRKMIPNGAGGPSGADEARGHWSRYISDERFQSVFLLLANRLPENYAFELDDLIRANAADIGNNVLDEEYHKGLLSRGLVQ
jgi:hypothetical protein